MDDERIRKLLVYCELLPPDEQAALVEALGGKIDIHTKTAMELFDVPPSKVTADMRRRAKTINFGEAYGNPEATAPEKRPAITYTFKRKSDVVVRILISKHDLSPAVGSVELVHDEGDGVVSFRIPIEPESGRYG
jgi:DNA polymerase family A